MTLRSAWPPIRRILITLPVLWVVVSVVFLLIHLVPGDPIQMMLGDGATPADIGALRHQYGLDLPLGVQYMHYWAGVFRDETPALEQGDLPVEGALRESGDGLQVADGQRFAMTGQRCEDEQHTFCTGDILFRVHGHDTTNHNAVRMPERSQISKIDFPPGGNGRGGFSREVEDVLVHLCKEPPTFPWMKLSGRWIETAGFEPGQRVRITVEHQKLIITPL